MRLPDDVIGIDVDAYGRKTGGTTCAEAQKRWGPLPSGYRISARTDPAPGIRLFRVPPGTVLRQGISFPDLHIGDVEIIQRHHRYVVVWPSIHPSGVPYHWWREADTSVLESPPAPADLPELPAAWLAALQEQPARNGREYGSHGRYDVRKALTEGDVTGRVDERLAQAVTDLLHPTGSRHDATRDHVLALLRYGKQGDAGVAEAVRTIGELFVEQVGGDRDGGADEAVREFREFVHGPKAAALLAEPDYEDVRAEDLVDDGGESGPSKVSSDAPKLWRAADLSPSAQPNWLARYRLQRSAVNLLIGDEGIGKSLLWVWIAAAVTTGKALPEWGIPARDRRGRDPGVHRGRLVLHGAAAAGSGRCRPGHDPGDLCRRRR